MVLIQYADGVGHRERGERGLGRKRAMPDLLLHGVCPAEVQKIHSVAAGSVEC